jgi:hypothetical protein
VGVARGETPLRRSITPSLIRDLAGEADAKKIAGVGHDDPLVKVKGYENRCFVF